MKTFIPLQEAALKALVVDGPLSARLLLVGASAGFYVTASVGERRLALHTKKGELRMFTAVGAIRYIKDVLCVQTFEIDATQFVEGRLRQPRPDRAIALRGTRSKPEQQRLIFTSNNG